MTAPVRSNVLPVHVEFGHCDPAGIVWYPNFYEWFDAASHRLAERAGVGLHALRAQGYLGLPLMQTGASYHRPVRFATTSRCTARWCRSNAELPRRAPRAEGRRGAPRGFEVRFLGAPHPDDPARLRAAEIPASVPRGVRVRLTRGVVRRL